MKNKIWTSFFLFVGSLFIFIAIAAKAIHIDSDATWGKDRYLLLAVGCLIIALTILLNKFNEVFLHTCKKIKEGFNKIPEWIFISLAILISMIIYLWFFTDGTFTTFHPINNPYIDQAKAFYNGSLAILEEPNAELAELPDPYDSEQRKDIPSKWDYSYYQGKYFLYFGPAPALLIVPFYGLFKDNLPGQITAVLGLLGYLLGCGCLIWSIRHYFFPKTPAYLTGLFTLLMGINMPIAFIFARPYVYEGAIIFGQCFLIWGIALIFLAEQKNFTNYWFVFLAGLAFSMAISSRYTLLFSVALFSLLFVLKIWFKSKTRWKSLLSFIMPMFLIGISLLTYNFLRFQNPFETGLSYQFTVRPAENRAFSIDHFRSNFYLYSLYPPELQKQFPFTYISWANMKPLPSQFTQVRYQYKDHAFYGWIPGVPIAVFGALLGIFSVIEMGYKSFKNRTTTLFQKQWLFLAAGFAFFIQFFINMGWYYSAGRFLADSIPLLLIVSIFAIYNFREKLSSHTIGNKVFTGIVILLIIITCCLALLGAFSYNTRLSPEFFEPIGHSIDGKINQISAHISAYIQRISSLLSK